MWQFPIARLLTASVIAGILGVSSIFLTASVLQSDVSVALEPAQGTVLVGEQFKVSLIVDSKIPTNAYKGVLQFDSQKLAVLAIDYNTSIANLWAEAPWYSNGDGTVSFIGGTTKPGGFTGNGSLITITFETKAVGDAALHVSEIQILKHDGLGTEAPLNGSIDGLFAVSEDTLRPQTLFKDELDDPEIHIVRTIPNTDLNNDGVQNMADASMFMSDFVTQNLRSDFSGDGRVDLQDVSFFSIL